jgi:hypothetical protein
MQVQRLPLTVSTTQHRHAPIPHAMRFSSDTSHIMSFGLQKADIAFIMESGPQQHILLYFRSENIE